MNTEPIDGFDTVGDDPFPDYVPVWDANKLSAEFTRTSTALLEAVSELRIAETAHEAAKDVYEDAAASCLAGPTPPDGKNAEIREAQLKERLSSELKAVRLASRAVGDAKSNLRLAEIGWDNARCQCRCAELAAREIER